MNKELEEKISKQVQYILERGLGVYPELGSYLLGAQMAAEKLIPYVMQNYRGDEKVYIKAELDLITASKTNMQLWLGGSEMRYRNHKRNKKGKLESVECYFVEYRNVITDVK